jgi:signal peptidase I
MRKQQRNNKEKASGKGQSVAKEVSCWAAVLVIALFIMTFNLQTFGIPSSSMEKTLLVGDHLIVDRITVAPKTSWAFWEHYREIHRGDIIVFCHPLRNNSESARQGRHLALRFAAFAAMRA